MSRKTMDEYPLLYNIWEPPDTTWPTNDDTRALDLIAGKLDGDDYPVRAYQRAWDPGHHLANASEDFRDALWDINEGKRDVTNRRS